MRPDLCLLRGGGDLATGIAWRITRGGWPVMVCELARPLTVRRTVAMSTAVGDGRIDVEGMIGRRAASVEEAAEIARSGDVGVVVAPELPDIGADVVRLKGPAGTNAESTVDDETVSGNVVALQPRRS